MGKPSRLLLFAALIAAIAGAFLLSPRPARPVVCAEDVRITPALGFPLNCDSRVFIGLARRPDALFDGEGAGRTWQSRPLFVAAGALARAWCRTGLDAAGWHPRVDDIDASAWLGYVLVNFFLLVAAMAAFESIVRPWRLPTGLLLALASFFAANLVVKGFFWTPHTQIFNVLVPLLGIAWIARALEQDAGAGRRAARMLLVGLLSLAYGSFLALGASMALAEAFRAGSRRAAARRLAGSIALMALPPIAWITFLRLTTGAFYSYETGFYHEFVWVAEALGRGAGPFRDAVITHVGRFAKVASPVLAVPAAALALVAIVARIRGFRVADLSPDARRVFAACGWVLAANLPFFAFLGYYADRLAWNFVPPILVAAVVVAAELRRRGSIPSALFVAAGSVAAAANLAIWALRPNA